MKYINMKTNHGVETVDQLDPEDFETMKAFRSEVRRLLYEYRLSGMNVYTSSRCDKTWK